ncbi:MAG: LEA type 2 family protein [Gammaproteobacteria bacterium]
MTIIPGQLSRAILLLFCAAALTACSSFGGYEETPRVSLVSIQPLEMGLLEQRYALQLRIMNPNDVTIPMKGLSYSIDINDHEFAYGVSRQPVSIPPFSEALLDVEVVSNLLNVMRQFQQMSDDTNESLKYRLSGNISLGTRLRRLPFNVEGELNWLSKDKAGTAVEK